MSTSISVAKPGYATKKNKSLTKREKHIMFFKAIAAESVNTEKIKKTRGGTRLLSSGGNQFNGTSFNPGDSVQYSYLSSYGYDVTPEIFEFDYMNAYFYNELKDAFDKAKRYSFDGTSLQLTDSTVNTFTSNHLLATSNTSTLSPAITYYLQFIYNASNLRTDRIDSIDFMGTSNITKESFMYNASNKVLEVRYYEKAGSLWTLTSIDSLSYDASNRLTKATSYVDNAGVLTKDFQMLLTYTTSNKIETQIEQIWDAGAWVNDVKTQHIYGTGAYPLSTTYLDWDAGTWVNDTKDSFAYTGPTYPTTYWSLDWDDVSNTWLNTNRAIYTYNTANQVLTEKMDTWNGTSFDNQSNTNFYYENYIPTDVVSISNNVNSLKVYPIPASETIHVTFQSPTTEKTSLTILNQFGQILHQKQLLNSSNINEQINISFLPSGNYIMQLRGDKTNASARFTK